MTEAEYLEEAWIDLLIDLAISAGDDYELLNLLTRYEVS